MNSFFFDVATKWSVQYDFRGCEFERFEQVREMAELIAIDIVCTESEDFGGVEVQVRNISGQKLFAVPI